MTLKNREYAWVRTSKSSSDSHSHWQENRNGHCVVVRTAGGRYGSIVYTPASDFEGGKVQAPPGQAGKGFDIVCGVFVGATRHNYNYKCKIEDPYEGNRKAYSVLYFPDQALKMAWKPGDVVELHFEGMIPKTSKHARFLGARSTLISKTRRTFTP